MKILGNRYSTRYISSAVKVCRLSTQPESGVVDVIKERKRLLNVEFGSINGILNKETLNFGVKF